MLHNQDRQVYKIKKSTPKYGKIKKAWKSAWKVCKTSAKYAHLSTFPRRKGVEKWKNTRSIYSFAKNQLVEFKKLSKFILTKKYSLANATKN